MSTELKAAVLGLGLVIAALVVSWISAIVFGGFKIGSLEKRVSFAVKRDDMEGFMARFYYRLSELGFQRGTTDGQFVQGQVGMDELSAFTHARTKKELTLVMRNDHPPEATVELTLRYLDPIIGDSGESAYRDAVLDYVSGTTDTMQLVANRSFAAQCSLVGGVCTWIALFVLKGIHYEPLARPILILGLTEAFTGVLAILAIRRKPGELTGTGIAVAGIAVSLAAAVCARLMGQR
jgi:hypothetical protein